MSSPASALPNDQKTYQVTVEKNKARIFKTAFSSIYPLYLEKVEKKGRTKVELDAVICWLTGFDASILKRQIESKNDFETFFKQAEINPNAYKITGVICGYRVEKIEDELMQKIRHLDKVVDELAKGKALEKIFRQ